MENLAVSLAVSLYLAFQEVLLWCLARFKEGGVVPDRNGISTYTSSTCSIGYRSTDNGTQHRSDGQDRAKHRVLHQVFMNVVYHEVRCSRVSSIIISCEHRTYLS